MVLIEVDSMPDVPMMGECLRMQFDDGSLCDYVVTKVETVRDAENGYILRLTLRTPPVAEDSELVPA